MSSDAAIVADLIPDVDQGGIQTNPHHVKQSEAQLNDGDE